MSSLELLPYPSTESVLGAFARVLLASSSIFHYLLRFASWHRFELFESPSAVSLSIIHAGTRFYSMLHIQNKIQQNSHVCDTPVYEFVETAHELPFSTTYRYIHLKRLRNTCPPSRRLEGNSDQMNLSNIYTLEAQPYLCRLVCRIIPFGSIIIWRDDSYTSVGWLQLYWEVIG